MFSPVSFNLTFVIPVRNERRYLPDLVRALQTQSNPRWRAFIIDGGSTDGTWEYLQTLPARFQIYCGLGRGMYADWNYGLRLAGPGWVSVQPGDDRVEPNFVARVRTRVAAGSSGQSYLFGWNHLGPEGQVVRNFSQIVASQKPNLRAEVKTEHVLMSSVELHNLVLGVSHYQTLNSLVWYNRSDLVIPENKSRFGDLWFYLRILERSEVCFCPEVIASWRLHSSQTTTLAPTPESVTNRADLLDAYGTQLSRTKSVLQDYLTLERDLITGHVQAGQYPAYLHRLLAKAIAESPQNYLTVLRSYLAW